MVKILLRMYPLRNFFRELLPRQKISERLMPNGTANEAHCARSGTRVGRLQLRPAASGVYLRLL
jgi:hypothetical protein